MHTGSNRQLSKVWACVFNVLIAVCAIVLSRGVAQAQETLSDASYTAASGRLFCEDDVIDLAACIELNAEQKVAIEALFRTGLARNAEAYQTSRSDRQIARLKETRRRPAFNSPEYEQWWGETRAGWIAFSRSQVALERETLQDVRSTLTEVQVARGWSAFESRRRRRLILTEAEYGALPRQLLRGLTLSAESSARVDAILRDYDEKAEPLIVARSAATRAENEKILRDRVAKNMYIPDPELRTWEVRNLNIRTARAIDAVLQPREREAFLRRRIGLQESSYESFAPPSADAWYASVLAERSVTTEQKRAVQDLMDAADQSVLALALEWLTDMDQSYLRMPDPRTLVRSAAELEAMNAKIRDSGADPISDTENTDRERLMARRIERTAKEKLVIRALKRSVATLLSDQQLASIDKPASGGPEASFAPSTPYGRMTWKPDRRND